MRIWAFLIASLLLAGCAAKAKIDPNFKSENVGQLALLPIKYPSNISRERAQYLHLAVISALKGSGFLVLDDQTVNRICSSAQCPERSKLSSNYMVDNFAELELTSISRDNFLAGYYNAINGQLNINDKAGKQVFSLKQTESEKGGLLFNSGQLLEGLRSTAKNASHDSFESLADKFARSLVDKIPSQKKVRLNTDAVAVNVDDIELKALHAPIYRICSKATPNSMVYFISGRNRSNLREVSSGKYCGNYSLESYIYGAALPAIEVRSPFGNSIKKDLDLRSVSSLCGLNGLLSLQSNASNSKLLIACGQADSAECMSRLKRCQHNKFIVFRGDPPLSPYQRIAEFKGSSWMDSKSGLGPRTYAVIAVNDQGVRSQPVPIGTDKQS